MNKSIDELVSSIEDTAKRMADEKLPAGYVYLIVSEKHDPDGTLLSPALFMALTFHAQRRHLQFRDAVIILLRRNFGATVNVSAARAVAALAADVQAQAEAQALEMDLTISPLGIIWGTTSSFSVAWRNGAWHGMLTHFEKTDSLMTACRVSQNSRTLPWGFSPQCN